LCIATLCDMMTAEPAIIPDAPPPAIDLPSMSVIELGAAAQMTDPTSKTKSAMQYERLTLKQV
jgi:hypothetical protein